MGCLRESLGGKGAPAIGWLAGGEPVDLAELARARSGISIGLA